MGRKMRFAVVLWVCTGLCLMASPALSWPVPDTGLTKCYDDVGNEIDPCPSPGEPFYGQDANYTINPMSYTKLGYGGEELPDSATEWIMVRDDVTGLLWEVKTNDGTIHDMDNTYTWYDINPETNGGDAGTPGDGTDTEDFINALNSQSFGGFNDWRLPFMDELKSIVNYGAKFPAVNGGFFPNNSIFFYWSSSSYALSPSKAWEVFFDLGYELYNDKSDDRRVRAVRGGQSHSFDHFIINGDGTVTDTWTGLMWQQVGSDSVMVWEDGLSYSESMTLGGYTDWRLPSVKELASIVDRGRYDPAIDDMFFTGDLSDSYWSSSSIEGTSRSACYVDFYYGFVNKIDKENYNFVRAVRCGQSRLFGHLIISVPAQASFWTIGENMPITWDTAGISGNLSIKLSREGGREGTFDTIITDSTPNDGSFDWTVTGPGTPNCVLKIVPLDAPDYSTTQGLFTILGSDTSIVIDKLSFSINEPDGVQLFNIRLKMAPTRPVTIPLYPSVPDQFELSDTSVTLSASNFIQGVDVTVTALDNDVYEDERTVIIRTGPAESDDPDFNGIDPDDITVTLQDDESENLSITSVTPNAGVVGQDLEITIIGTAFSEYTDVILTAAGYSETYGNDDIELIDSTEISLSLKSPPDAGDYVITVINGAEEYSLENAVSFEEEPTIITLYGKKAIVVAGGNPSLENALWPATRTCANMAYFALNSQGYQLDKIRYLSPESFIDVTGDGVNDRFGDTTLAELNSAVNDWPSETDTEELLLYLTDHGGNGTFRLNDTEILSAATLDAWLDVLQSENDMRVIVIVDACQSGSFISSLTPPSGAERYVVASSRPDDKAWFLDEGETSFSYFFWESVYLNGRLYRAFLSGEHNISGLFQYPSIDIDGDGNADSLTSTNLANDVIIGLGKVAASDPLKINETCGSLTVGCDNTATFWVEDLVYTDGISNVWARVVPPAENILDPSKPGLNLHLIRMSDMDQDGRYEGGYSDFRQDGNYAVLFYLEDKRGNRSLPSRISVFRNCGVTPETGDLDGDELVTLADGLLALQVMSGREPRTFRADYPTAGVDVNENDHVDMAEAIFAFQKVAGIR